MTTTGKLGIPLISSQQNQPEVTHNTAVAMLQALAMGAIALQNAPPGGTPNDGDTYIVGDTPTGAWAARANKIATWYNNGWLYIPGNDSSGTPIAMGAAQAGLTIYLESELGLVTWTGAHWYGTSPASSD